MMVRATSAPDQQWMVKKGGTAEGYAFVLEYESVFVLNMEK
jgi:hypothetical protein